MIGEAQSLVGRKKKAGGVKEMLQDATKLTHKLRFLVEEVCICSLSQGDRLMVLVVSMT